MSSLRDRCSWPALILALLILPMPLVGQAPEEASRVRVLLVLDTDDHAGSTWGLDGENMKDILEATLKKQKLEGRFTIEVFTGKQAAPETVLKYYADLKTDKSEALVFYFSGHGAYHIKKGHFMAFHWGNLYRNDLVAAMKKHEPRLAVILTDCCANYVDGGGTAAKKEPVVVSEGETEKRDSPQNKVRKEEPPGGVVVSLLKKGPTKKPDLKAKKEEPKGNEESLDVDLRPHRPLARVAEPKVDSIGKAHQLVTANGIVALQEILDKTDGVVMRDLLFRSKGFIDINACKKGALSHGERSWGGSIFTNSLLLLQKESWTKFDANGNKRIEWDEFFPHLVKGTKDAGWKIGQGRIVQEPEFFLYVTSRSFEFGPAFRPPRER